MKRSRKELARMFWAYLLWPWTLTKEEIDEIEGKEEVEHE